MGFWGIEVKPGKKVNPFGAANTLGKLRITQATLGLGSSDEKSILQCFRDQKSPIFLCTLLPDKIESCSLDLEFDEDDSVTFSVVGRRSIHLSGYFLEEDDAYAGEDGYGFDHIGEDIAGSGSEESSDYDSEDAFEDDLSDEDTYSDDDHFNIIPNSGVVIEEIMDEDKDANEKSQSKQQKKNKQTNSMENVQEGQIVPRNNASVPVLESEDEDGFPTSKAALKKKCETTAPEQADDETTDKVQKKNKRGVKTTEQEDQPDRQKKRKKQKKNDKEGKNDEVTGDVGTAVVMEDQKKLSEIANGEADQLLPREPPKDNKENQIEKKKTKTKNKKLQEAGDQPGTTKAEKNASTLSEEKPSQVRTFPNGLVVEELEMGKPDGKRAAPGKQVSVHYIGKLQKNGKIFDSNVGRAPFKFRLGIGQVIKGWDVGVNGMRVGDKRRLTIPPSMGYGAQGAGGKIPPNSWLVFDVELVDVR